MHARAIHPRLPDRFLIAGALFSALAASVLWSGVVISQWPILMSGGTICGPAQGFLGHCAACGPALAATLVSVVLTGFAVRRSA